MSDQSIPNLYVPYVSNPNLCNRLDASMRGPLKFTLLNDFLSKYCFQKDHFAFVGLLAALLDIDENSITHILILNPVSPSDVIDGKMCILDILLELNHDTRINIEIQATFQSFWAERSLTYLSRSFNHLKNGESYSNVKKTIHIGILDTDPFSKEDERYTGQFHSHYSLKEDEVNTEYSSKFSLNVVSLNHLEDVPNDKRGNNSLYQWGRVFKADTWEELIDIANDNERIRSLMRTMMMLTAEDRIRYACEARWKAQMDINSYNYEINELKNTIANKDSELAEKDAEIARLMRLLGEQ